MKRALFIMVIWFCFSTYLAYSFQSQIKDAQEAVKQQILKINKLTTDSEDLSKSIVDKNLTIQKLTGIISHQKESIQTQATSIKLKDDVVLMQEKAIKLLQGQSKGNDE